MNSPQYIFFSRVLSVYLCLPVLAAEAVPSEMSQTRSTGWHKPGAVCGAVHGHISDPRAQSAGISHVEPRVRGVLLPPSPPSAHPLLVLAPPARPHRVLEAAERRQPVRGPRLDQEDQRDHKAEDAQAEAHAPAPVHAMVARPYLCRCGVAAKEEQAAVRAGSGLWQGMAMGPWVVAHHDGRGAAIHERDQNNG